jgi:hypothetical protein
MSDDVDDNLEFKRGVAQRRPNATTRAAMAEARTQAEKDAVLDEIGRLAMACWMDMQGRLVDDEHRRAHRVLRRIAAMAAARNPGTPPIEPTSPRLYRCLATKKPTMMDTDETEHWQCSVCESGWDNSEDAWTCCARHKGPVGPDPRDTEIARLRAALTKAVEIALDGCLVPPDGGSPTEEEREMCERIAERIAALLR